MRKVALFSAAISLGVLACGGGDGEVTSVSGVWKGSYEAQLSVQQTGDAPKGPVCLELSQNGTQLTGKAWISGYLWGSNFNGTISGNAFQGTVNGKDLNNIDVTVSFDGTITDTQISGTIMIGSKQFNVSLSREQNSSNCNYADRALVEAFARALGSAYSNDPNNPNTGIGNLFASFITEVPKVNVKVDGTQYQDWWACVWEIRDRVSNREMTLGAIIDTTSFEVPPVYRGASWIATNSTPDIGLDSSNNPQSFTETLGGSGNASVAIYADFSQQPIPLIFAADGANDNYYNDGTTLQGQPFYISPCQYNSDYGTNIQAKVWMTELPFYIKFDGPDANSTIRSFESPPNPSNTNLNRIPSLYVEVNQCTP